MHQIKAVNVSCDVPWQPAFVLSVRVRVSVELRGNPDFALKAYRLANATYALWTYGRIVWNSQLLVVFWSHLVLWLEIEIFCWVSLMTNIFTLSNKLAR